MGNGAICPVVRCCPTRKPFRLVDLVFVVMDRPLHAARLRRAVEAGTALQNPSEIEIKRLIITELEFVISIENGYRFAVDSATRLQDWDNTKVQRFGSQILGVVVIERFAGSNGTVRIVEVFIVNGFPNL